MQTITRITPCLWFDDQAEPAANFYVDLFPNSRILTISRYGEAGRDIHGKEPGTVMTVAFELDGQGFTARNGGPRFKFTEAVSFQVHCDTQEQIDRYWERLSEGGEVGPCGWLKDRFGASWQVIPDVLIHMLNDPDHGKSQQAMAAMFKMKKIDIAELERAYAGEELLRATV